MKMMMNKKNAKLLTFDFIVGGATAIYLYFSKNKKQEPPPPPKKTTGKVYISGYVSTKSSDLNIRKEPNTTSDIVGKLKNGAIANVLDIGVDGWYQLLDNINFKPIGYVSAQYISIEDKDKKEP
jgi:uncharacterized protein YgiM (DUF1202 family)